LAIKRTVATSRRAHGVGGSHPHPVLRRAPCSYPLWDMGVPPNLQRASRASLTVNEESTMMPLR
jgi:hypothetical protein